VLFGGADPFTQCIGQPRRNVFGARTGGSSQELFQSFVAELFTAFVERFGDAIGKSEGGRQYISTSLEIWFGTSRPVSEAFRHLIGS